MRAHVREDLATFLDVVDVKTGEKLGYVVYADDVAGEYYQYAYDDKVVTTEDIPELGKYGIYCPILIEKRGDIKITIMPDAPNWAKKLYEERNKENEK